MERKKINKKIWSDFLSVYASCGSENKISKKIMLAAIMAVLLLNAATICYIAIRNQPQGVEMMEELLQMLLLLVLSSGVVGFGMMNKSSSGKEDGCEKKSNNNIKKGAK